MAVARALGTVDVGQGCVVQQGIVLAVEAIEGTDAMLARAAELRRPGPGEPIWVGDCQPMVLRCGLPLALPERGSWLVGGSSVGGGPYMAGCDVSDGRLWPPLNDGTDGGVEPGDERGLCGWKSARMCGGSDRPPMKLRSLDCRGSIGMGGISLAGDAEVLRRLGGDAERADPASEYMSPSERDRCAECGGREASAAAVAAAASSTVPVWWL